MKIIRRVGTMCMLLLVLTMGIYGFQVSTARGDVDVSKRQDFATDDTKFGTNEEIYIRIDLDQLKKLVPGKARLNVFVKQRDKNRLRESVPLVVTGPKTEVSYRDDIQPLFTQDRAWFDAPELASLKCITCHHSDVPNAQHNMDLSTREGMLAGADRPPHDPPAIPILGESFVGATDYNWEKSELRRRQRNNRMPPGWPLTLETLLDRSTRDGPNIVHDSSADGDDLNIPGDFSIKRDAAGNYEYGAGLRAVNLIGAWVTGTSAGINDGNGTSFGGDTNVTWADVAPFFTSRDTWFNGSLACAFCHFSNVEPPSFHAMDLSSAAGLRGGADGGTEPILGESAVGATDFNWSASGLRGRLRNNRMPPTSPFVLDESNRNGPTLVHPVTGALVSAGELLGEWVNNGAKDN